MTVKLTGAAEVGSIGAAFHQTRKWDRFRNSSGLPHFGKNPLTPAQNSCRLVGATQGEEDARSDNAVDWGVYSAFVEDRVLVNLEKVAEGDYNISPPPLLPGEHAVVLRPVSKAKGFPEERWREAPRSRAAGKGWNSLPPKPSSSPTLV